MKKNFYLVSLLAAFALAIALPLSAQEVKPAAAPDKIAPDKGETMEQVTDSYIQIMRKDIRGERKKIVAANLPLSEDEATKFWPLYDRYIGETIKVNDIRYALIKEYASNFASMTDAQAESFIKRWVALDGDNTQLRLKYIPEFEKIIPKKKTAMFFQIDRRVGMLIELQLANQMPLIEP